jgi:hypothetical protein
MPRGSRPGERRGGRAKGTPNRTTVERAAIAARIADEANMRGQKLGKEYLAKYAALRYPPRTEAHPRGAASGKKALVATRRLSGLPIDPASMR